jgi:hypothetical protein
VIDVVAKQSSGSKVPGPRQRSALFTTFLHDLSRASELDVCDVQEHILYVSIPGTVQY